MKTIYTFILFFFGLIAHGQDLPCRAYFEGTNRCKEKYGVDNQGRKHGKYVQFNKSGQIILSGNYTHDVPQGTFVGVNSLGTVTTGNFVNGKAQGSWKSEMGMLGVIYNWYEKGEIIANSSRPIASFAEANKIAEKNSRDAKKVASVRNEAQEKAREQQRAQEQQRVEASTQKVEELPELYYHPNAIEFGDDSYRLDKRGTETLQKIAKWANSNKGLKMIGISAHAEKGDGDDNREKMLFVLTLNRALVVKKFLQEKIKNKNIEYKIYGCGTLVNPGEGDFENGGSMDEKRVEILFDKGMPAAYRRYKELSDKYSIMRGNSIIPNEELKANILRTIESYYGSESVRNILEELSANPASKSPEEYQKIPTESWIEPTNPIYEGENPNEFRQRVENLIKKLNKSYNVEIKPHAFFYWADKKLMSGIS